MPTGVSAGSQFIKQRFLVFVNPLTALDELTRLPVMLVSCIRQVYSSLLFINYLPQ